MGSGLAEQIAATRGIRHYPINELSAASLGSHPNSEETGFPVIRPGTGSTSPYSALARESNAPPHDTTDLTELGQKGVITLNILDKDWEATLLRVAESVSAGATHKGPGVTYFIGYAVSEALRNAHEYGGSLDGVSRLARVVWNVEGDSPLVVISNDCSALFNPVKHLNRPVDEVVAEVEQCATANSHIFLQSLASYADHLEFTWESPSRGERIQCTLQKLSDNREDEEIPFRLVVAYNKDGFPQSDFNLFKYLENNDPPPLFEKFSIGVAF